MIAVALNDTDSPAQMVVAEAPTITEGVEGVFTAIVMLLDVAAVGEAQLEPEVMIQLTTSLFAMLLVLKTALLVPALAPLIIH